MHIIIFGAYGFLGKQLTEYCLEQTDWQVSVVSRSRRPAFWNEQYGDRIRALVGDVRDATFLHEALHDVNVAYYLIHFMGHKGIDMYQAETQAAQIFAAATRDSGVDRVVYMGGLGEDKADNSEHLRSRYQTGVELRAQAPLVIELRASMILGNGSVSFDIIDSLARKLPIIILPKSAATRTQPIAQADALRYLLQAATLPARMHQIVDIGGPEVMSYRDLYVRYLAFLGKRPRVYITPLVSPHLEARFLNLFIPKKHSRIGRAIIDSLATELVVRNQVARKLFPDIEPIGLEAAFRAAKRERPV